MRQSIRPYEGSENLEEKIKIYHHLDLNPEEKQLLKDAILKIREKRLIRAEGHSSDFRVNESQLDYLIDSPNRFTIIMQDAENNPIAYGIYAIAANGETLLEESIDYIYTLEEITCDRKNIQFIRTLLAAMRNQAKEEHSKAGTKYFRIHHQVDEPLPENREQDDIFMRNAALIREKAELVTQTSVARSGVMKIPNGRQGNLLDYFNEPPTDLLDHFLTDQIISERVVYCQNMRVDPTEANGEVYGTVDGYYFICEANAEKSMKVKIKNGVPSIHNEDEVLRIYCGINAQNIAGLDLNDLSRYYYGLNVQRITEQDCPVAYNYLKSYQQRRSNESNLDSE